MILPLAVALVGAALAEDPVRAWETLYDARLVEASDGTPEVAALYYEEVVADLAADDPLYGAAWYWLGRARYGLGDTEAAIAALRRAMRDTTVRARAGALLARIELRSRAITALPVTFGFEVGGTGAFVRAWDHAGKGGLEARAIQGRALLAWSTTVLAGEPDHIAAALEVEKPVSKVTFQVRAQAFPAELRVTVSDGAGGRYSAPVLQVPTGEWLDVTLPASSFRSTDGARGGAGSALRADDPVRLLEIEDLTGLLTPDRGENIIYVDTFEIR
ncbi:MAG: tetratricopeptide repeat protein [Pseudomonadota bacterium]|nr:tetratricopeptide repeat protein [Pseudomonadota bacterium]